MRFVDPRNDFAFKKIFGDENKKEILISFLNSILQIENTSEELVDIKIANPQLLPDIELLKDSILDIFATDTKGVKYIIEMQIYHVKSFSKRALYYAAKTYYQQLERAEDYTKLNKVIFIGICDFQILENDDYYSKHLIMNALTNEHYIRDLEFHFIELPKFNKLLSELITIRDKWMYFIKNAKSIDIVPNELDDIRQISSAFIKANKMAWSLEELDFYDRKGIFIQDQRGSIEYAYELGEEKGIEKGIAIGEEKGIEKGIAIGEEIIEKKVKQKALDIAVNLIGKIDNNAISQITGLSLEEIIDLQNPS